MSIGQDRFLREENAQMVGSHPRSPLPEDATVRLSISSPVIFAAHIVGIFTSRFTSSQDSPDSTRLLIVAMNAFLVKLPTFSTT